MPFLRNLYFGMLLLLVLFIPSQKLEGQSFGNEWIDHGQQYYRIPVTETGVHRIDRSTLSQAGVPVGTIDPRRFQIFGREKERYIYVKGESDGSFDPGDHIEFYAEENDGWLDSLLYSKPDKAGNPPAPNKITDPHYSLYNDTINYYLTWNASTNNRRMDISQDSAYGSYPSADYVWRTSLRSLNSRYSKGQRGFFDSYPQFTPGEGWVGSLFNKSQQREHFLKTPDPYQSGGAPDADLTAVSVSMSNASPNGQGYNHHLQVRYGTGLGTVMMDTTYYGYQLNRFDLSLPNADIGIPQTRIVHRSIDDLGVATDYHSVSYIELRYPFAMDMGGWGRLHFEVPFVAGKQHLGFSGFGGNEATAYVLDGQVERLPVVTNSGDADLVLPQQGGGGASECYITARDSLIEVKNVDPVMGNGSFRDFSAIDPDSAYLILTHSKLMSEAQSYANYRRSPNGSVKAVDPVVVNVRELYHQFGGGVPKHALAIRRFCAFALDEWSSPPRALFLIGKSVREANESDAGARKSASAYSENLVPSMGYPSTDLLLTAGLGGASAIESRIPVGRLSAKTPQGVLDYLTKVKQYENKDQPNQAREWMKRVLHFGGGSNKQQQNTFAGYLNGYETTIEAPYFGGKVHTFLKTSSSPISINVSDSVKTLINGGASLMTFFGHGSGSGFDQSIDEPSAYSNSGKYPLLIANSCYSGDIHQPNSISTSEKFVLADQKGTIGFIASVKQGVSGSLNRYSSRLYDAISKNAYGKPIGRQMQWAVENMAGADHSYSKLLTALGMSLHGDPFLSLYSWDKPEYKVEPKDMTFDPADVTPQVDSFDVNLAISNIGRATQDTFGVNLTRSLPGSQGSQKTYNRTHSKLYYRDTVNLTMPVDGLQANGINSFGAKVDRNPDAVPELFDEVSNNLIEGRELLIRTGDVFPVDPFEYAIIPDDSVTLQASTGDPFEAVQPIHFQVDTTDRYNSPMLRTTDIDHAGGVVEWKPPMELSDSTVYYWRVSPDSSNTKSGSPRWRESSFQHIPNEWGWGQSHFFQYKHDGFQNIDYDRNTRDFEFFKGKKALDCIVYGQASNPSEYNGTLWRFDLEQKEYGGCGLAPAIHVAVIDPSTSEVWGTYAKSGAAGNGPYVNQDHQFGNANNGTNCRDRVENYFIFRQGNATQMQALEDMLKNEVPDGHYVLVYTWRFASYDDWTANNPNLDTLLRNWGSDSIGLGKDSVPFIFLTQKGSPDSAAEEYGSTIDEKITLSDEIQISANTGRIRSEVAGPAFQWDALYWDSHHKENNSFDSTRIEVVGIQKNGLEDSLASFPADKDSVPDLETYVDASQYPYLRLEAELSDTVDVTPQQLERWQLLHQPAPEAAVDPSLGYDFHADTVQQGEKVEMAIPIRNISAFDMDSMLVGYWFRDQNGSSAIRDYRKLDALPAGSTLVDTARFSTRRFPGKNAFTLKANPIDTATGHYDQLEQYHFNNIARKNFYAAKDRTNPILDVTFDGRRIMDGDIVSSEPKIRIELDDENQYMLLDEVEDTSNFDILLKDPSGNQQQIYFNNSDPDHDLTWIPASSKKNEFKIDYNPSLDKDGTYELLVQGQDKSGNASGDLRYKISFEVINKMTVTNVLNYPNPFSTRTQFVFTLTGDKVPDRFKIRILTVSGKVVKEISKDQLGPLHIGRNRTSYWWNGTDEFGDPLANGVYLYQVIVKDGGEDVEHRKTSADQYFEKGFGKMYLMR